jgi:hypothetical protein
VSLAKSLPLTAVPYGLVLRLKRLREDAASHELRLEVKWKRAKERRPRIAEEQRELYEWLAEQPDGTTILDASIAFDTTLQAMGGRLMRLVGRGLASRDGGRPAKFKVIKEDVNGVSP